MRSSSQKLLLRAVGIMLLVVLAPAVLRIYTNKRWKQNEERIQLLWSSQFESLSTNMTAANDISALRIKDGIGLTDSQRSNLLNAVIAFKTAHTVGGADALWRFANPAARPLSKERIESISTFFKHWNTKESKIGVTLDSNLIQHLAALSESKDDKQRFISFARVLSQETLYTNHWRDISWNTAELEISRSRNAKPIEIDDLLARLPNLGVGQKRSSFVSPSEDLALRQNPDLIVADFNVLVRLSEPDPISPFMIRWFFDAETEQWIPWILSWLNTERESRILLSF